ncbi:glycosyltransferase [Candidatus Saccharibacteria bacterium]|nr:glycosyltransferase [Candidatus Saccharibacteria bacterium]
MSKPRIAIVSDWIIGGGAERVIESLHKLYPDAPIYTSYCSDTWRKKLNNRVVTGYLQNYPFNKLRKFAGPLRISWYKNLDLSSFDIVISCTGNGEAKNIKTSGTTKHICYCFTPVHYYWRHYQTYINNPGFGAFNWLARLGLKLLIKPLQKIDYKAAQHPDIFVGISSHIQADIQKYYKRNSIVIAPPVDTKRFKKTNINGKRQGFVTMGRLATIKRTEIIVDACTKLGLPLTIIGRGPAYKDLLQRAGPTVQILNNVSDQQMPSYLASAQAFLFASFEDFGIAPVEAMATGTPIIAYKAGGALDYVNSQTGIFFNNQTSSSLQKAIKNFNGSQYDSAVIRSQAEAFSTEHFQKNITSLVKKLSK